MRYHNPQTMSFDHLPTPKNLHSKRVTFAENKFKEDVRKMDKKRIDAFCKANPKALRIPSKFKLEH